MNKKIIIAAIGLAALAACTKTISYNVVDIPNDFVGLPPLPADSGIQLHIPAFPLPPNFEREVWIRKDLNNPEDIYVRKFRSVSRAGTHHFVLTKVREDANFPTPPADVMIDQNNMDGKVNLLSNANMGQTLFIAQSPDYTTELPEGYAVRIPAKTNWLANPHYFNKTDKMRFGEVYCNIYTMKKEDVKYVLENTIVSGNETLILPPGKETVITTDQIYDVKTEVMLMTPHYHKRGKKFVVQIIGGPRNGEVILESYDYQHPVAINFANKPLILEKGEGLRTIVTYNNETSRTITYGVTSEDEMNFLFLYSRSL